MTIRTSSPAVTTQVVMVSAKDMLTLWLFSVVDDSSYPCSVFPRMRPVGPIAVN